MVYDVTVLCWLKIYDTSTSCYFMRFLLSCTGYIGTDTILRVSSIREPPQRYSNLYFIAVYNPTPRAYKQNKTRGLYYEEEMWTLQSFRESFSFKAT
jgi:hypothetical protein